MRILPIIGKLDIYVLERLKVPFCIECLCFATELSVYSDK